MSGRMCMLEKLLAGNGFKLIHDGKHNPGQFELPPEEIRCYTRKYRLQMDGQWCNTWVVFKYDERSNIADFEIYSKEPQMKGREKMGMNMEESKEDAKPITKTA